MRERGAAASDRSIRMCWMSVPRTQEAESSSLAMLNPEELARAFGFPLEQSRQLFIAGRAGLRLALSEILGMTPSEVPLQTGGAGVPLLGHLGGSHRFSVSHAGDWAVAAVGSASVLGVDLEPECSAEAVPKLVFRALTGTERTDLAWVRGQSPTEILTRCWVAKEAILKAAGCGLAIDPQRIVLSIGAGGELAVRSVPRTLFGGRQIEVRFVPAPAGYVAAIATDHLSSRFGVTAGWVR